MTQPTPDVTSADLARLVRRDYPPDRTAEVFTVLESYGTEKWHIEAHRVRAAVLKLAAGDLEQLRNRIGQARSDWRDVLSEAEYPGYTKVWSRIDKFPPEKRQQVIDKDWRQYQEWFTRA